MTRYIILRKPQDINTPAIVRQIVSHLNNGCKTSEILLECYFVASDEVIYNITETFRKLKNQTAFQLDTRFK